MIIEGASEMTTAQAADHTAAVCVLSDFFAAVSFPAGTRPDYLSMRGLFCECAQLIQNSGGIPEISTVDELIWPRQQQVDSGELRGDRGCRPFQHLREARHIQRRGFPGEGSHLCPVRSDRIGLEDQFDGVG